VCCVEGEEWVRCGGPLGVRGGPGVGEDSCHAPPPAAPPLRRRSGSEHPPASTEFRGTARSPPIGDSISCGRWPPERRSPGRSKEERAPAPGASSAALRGGGGSGGTVVARHPDGAL